MNKSEKPQAPALPPNLRFYEKLRTPEPWAVKPIKAGRLSGKSDISPQWRIKAMTELFGPVGFGWKFEIIRLWTEPAFNGQQFCFAQINVFYKDGDKWSEAIPAVGGDTLIEEEGPINDRHLHANDEAYKMAITDAFGKALTYLGVAADIYENRYDTKHERRDGLQPPQATARPPAGGLPPKGAPGALRPASQVQPPQKPTAAAPRPTDAEQKTKKCVINEQVRFIADLIKQAGISKALFEAWLFKHTNIKNVWDIPAADFEGIVKFIKDDPGTIAGVGKIDDDKPKDDIPPAGEDAPWEGNH
jgi:hypothetical protein